jgi:hypothetical protein
MHRRRTSSTRSDDTGDFVMQANRPSTPQTYRNLRHTLQNISTVTKMKILLFLILSGTLTLGESALYNCQLASD